MLLLGLGDPRRGARCKRRSCKSRSFIDIYVNLYIILAFLSLVLIFLSVRVNVIARLQKTRNLSTIHLRNCDGIKRGGVIPRLLQLFIICNLHFFYVEIHY